MKRKEGQDRTKAHGIELRIKRKGCKGMARRQGTGQQSTAAGKGGVLLTVCKFTET